MWMNDEYLCRYMDIFRTETLKIDLTSGVHLSGIFSSESGESIEKHIRMTSVSGYESGRSLS